MMSKTNTINLRSREEKNGAGYVQLGGWGGHSYPPQSLPGQEGRLEEYGVRGALPQPTDGPSPAPNTHTFKWAGRN